MGTGIYGGFGSGTIGVKKQTAPINSPEDVTYSKNKTAGYLLNPDHPVGGSKAKFMREVLGYEQTDSELFHKNVVSAIQGRMPIKTDVTQYGVKLTYCVKLVGKDGSIVSANVVVVMQRDHGQVKYKIVTVYPDRKG